MTEISPPVIGTPEEHVIIMQRTPSLTAVMKSMITIPATGQEAGRKLKFSHNLDKGELSTPKTSNAIKTPKRSQSEIEKEIALLTSSENILGFRRPLKRKSSNSSLKSINSLKSVSSVTSISSLSGGFNSIRSKLKNKIKRKRKLCDDLEDFDTTKRKRYGSNSNIVPNVTTPGRTKSATISRTNSLRMVRSPSADFIKPYPGPALTPSKVREHLVWQKTVDPFVVEHMPPALIRRQEAIYELLQGEIELVEDLNLVLKVFHGPMMQLGLASEEEMGMIFGNMEELLDVHQRVVNQLHGLQNQIGVYDNIAEVIADWIPKLACYSKYCSNQIYAKEVLDQLSKNVDVADFLERCRSSSFSRKLDLWSFLDSPRRRLPKYVLLIKNIMKMTVPTHPDKVGLQRSVDRLHFVLATVDRATGQAKCEKYKNRLVFLQEKHNTYEIQSAAMLLCDGPLKNKNGTKLHALLFDTVFLLTRQLQKEKLHYQVYRQPILVSDICVEDLPEVRVGGSFKRTFSTTGSEISKNFFRVWEGEGQGYQLSVQTGTKKQWIDSILNAKKQLVIKQKARVLPMLPRSIATVVETEDDLTPTTPNFPPLRLGSPPIEFITPQPKKPLSRADMVDYTPTIEGGKVIRSTSTNLSTSKVPKTPISGSPGANPVTSRVSGTPTSSLPGANPVTSRVSGTPSSKDGANFDSTQPKLLISPEQENRLNSANTWHGMTPFRSESPKLRLRNDDHVKRLVVQESPSLRSSPEISPAFTKSSRV